MQVSQNEQLEDGRSHYSIGRITACGAWRALQASVSEADKRAAIRALIREAENYDADAIVGLNFEIDDVRRCDLDGTPLQRVIATGVAVKFALAA